MTILSPMRQEAYEAFFESSVSLNAHDNVASGNWPAEEAIERSRAELKGFLPQGFATPHCHFYEIKAAAGGPTIGTIWFGIIERAVRVRQWNGLLPPNGIVACQTVVSIKQSKEEE